MMHLELIVRVNELAVERGEREARSILAAGQVLRYRPGQQDGEEIVYDQESADSHYS